VRNCGWVPPVTRGTTIEPEVSVAISPASLLEAFEWRCSHDPDAVFLRSLDGSGATYGEVGRRADAVRGLLVEAGVQSGTKIALYMDNAPAWVAATFAVWRHGGTVAAFGRLLSVPELRQILEGTPVVAVVTNDGTLQPGDLEVPIIRFGVSDEYAGGPAAPIEQGTQAATPDPSDEALVLFTSGTTGVPKPVSYSHAAVANLAERVVRAYAVDGGFRPTVAPDRLPPGPIFTPYGHIGGYTTLGFRLWIGHVVLLIPKFSVEVIREILGRYSLPALQLTPAMIFMLADAQEDVPLASLRYVTSGTAPLPGHVRQRFEERYGVPVLQMYGMTELGTVAQERPGDIAERDQHAGTVGRVAAGMEAKIVDGAAKEVAVGDAGEIMARRASLPGSPDEAAWFPTGDLGRFDADGFLYVVGRVKEMLIVGGFNVYPAEVEAAIIGTGLATDAVVVPVADERLGQIPAAGIVWSRGAQVDELRAELRDRLAHYKVPRMFVEIEAVPQTPRGKVDRSSAERLVNEAADQ
jgi:long-chain acyl-CoA synthetase